MRSIAASVLGLLSLAGVAQAQLTSKEFRIVERTGQTAVTSSGDAVLDFAVQARVNDDALTYGIGGFAFTVTIVGEAESSGTLVLGLISNVDHTYATTVGLSSVVGRGGLAYQYSYLAGINSAFNGLINTSSGTFTHAAGSQQIGLITGVAAGSPLLQTPDLDPNGEGNPSTWGGYGTGGSPVNGNVAAMPSAIRQTYFGGENTWIDVYRFRYVVTNLASRTLNVQLADVAMQSFYRFEFSSGAWGEQFDRGRADHDDWGEHHGWDARGVLRFDDGGVCGGVITVSIGADVCLRGRVLAEPVPAAGKLLHERRGVHGDTAERVCGDVDDGSNVLAQCLPAAWVVLHECRNVLGDAPERVLGDVDDGRGVFAECVSAAGFVLHEWWGVLGDLAERMRGDMDDWGDMFAECVSAAGFVLHEWWGVLGDLAERMRGDMDDWGDMFAECVSAAGFVLHEWWGVLGDAAERVRGGVDDRGDVLAESLSAAGSMLHERGDMHCHVAKRVRGDVDGRRKLLAECVPAAGKLLYECRDMFGHPPEWVFGNVDDGGNMLAECVPATGKLLHECRHVLGDVAERVLCDMDDRRGVFTQYVPAAGTVLHAERNLHADAAERVCGDVDDGWGVFSEYVPATGAMLHIFRGVLCRVPVGVYDGNVDGELDMLAESLPAAAGALLQCGERNVRDSGRGELQSWRTYVGCGRDLHAQYLRACGDLLQQYRLIVPPFDAGAVSDGQHVVHDDRLHAESVSAPAGTVLQRGDGRVCDHAAGRVRVGRA